MGLSAKYEKDDEFYSVLNKIKELSSLVKDKSDFHNDLFDFIENFIKYGGK